MKPQLSTIILSVASAYGCMDASAAVDLDESAIAQAIEQLGDTKFQTREMATRTLLESGPAAIPALRECVDHPDRETRFRSQWVLEHIETWDRRRRLSLFLNYQDSAETNFPGWDRMSDLVGDSRQSRQFFAEMVRTELSLLNTFQLHQRAGITELTMAVRDRCRDIQQSRTSFRNDMEQATVGTLLLLATAQDMELPDDLIRQLYSLCIQLPDAVRSERQSRPLRLLLGKWIVEAGDETTAPQRLSLALRFDISASVELAESVLQSDSLPGAQKQMPILTIAKMGQRRHVALLEPLLTDQSACGTFRDPKTRKSAKIQVRDLALAATIHLLGQDPKDFGFNHVKSHPTYGFVPTSLGFPTPQERTNAFKNWKGFLSQRNESKDE